MATARVYDAAFKYTEVIVNVVYLLTADHVSFSTGFQAKTDEYSRWHDYLQTYAFKL